MRKYAYKLLKGRIPSTITYKKYEARHRLDSQIQKKYNTDNIMPGKCFKKHMFNFIAKFWRCGRMLQYDGPRIRGS